MQNIRSAGTAPERKVMRELRRLGLYFAVNVKSLSGKPDIVFRRKRVAIFIDSDFWHGHKTRFKMPKSNLIYWREKIRTNKLRDKRVDAILKKEGWRIVRVWEHDVNNKFALVMRRIIKAIDAQLPPETVFCWKRQR